MKEDGPVVRQDEVTHSDRTDRPVVFIDNECVQGVIVSVRGLLDQLGQTEVVKTRFDILCGGHSGH